MKQNISLLLLLSCLSLSLQTPLSATSKVPNARQDAARAAHAQQQAERAEFLKNIQNSPYAQAAKDHLENAKAKRTVRSDCNDCGETFVITNEDLPKTIFDSGVYTVACDLQYTASMPLVPAIQILTDDVTIDFQGHTLSQVPCQPEETRGIYGFGVVIGEGYVIEDINAVRSNITLMNGTIRDFSATGVLAVNVSFFDGGAKLPFENLHFTDLNILHNGTDSIYYVFAQGLLLDSTNANPTTLGDVHPEIAFQNVVLERVHANENFNGLSTAVGVSMYTADNVMIRDSQINKTLGFGSVGLEIWGLNVQLISSQVNGTSSNVDFPCNRSTHAFDFRGNNLYIKDTQINDTHSDCCALIAADILGGNVLAEDSQFNNCNAGPTFAQIVGGGLLSVHLAPFSNVFIVPITNDFNSGYKFVRCQINGNSIDPENTSSDGVVGIGADFVNDLECVECQIANLNGAGTRSSVQGAILFDVSNATFTRCTFSNIRSSAFSVGIASQDFETGSNTVVQDCVIEHIHTTATESIAAGIINISSIPSNFYATGNRITDVYGEASNPFAAAITLVGVTGPVVKENSISDCARGIWLTDGLFDQNPTIPNSSFFVSRDGVNALQFGWQVDPATYPANNPITNDQLWTNIDRGNQTVAISPDEEERGLMSPDEDIRTWQTGDELIYNVPVGGIPVQLFDAVSGLNQVPYSGQIGLCFAEGSLAQYHGNGVVFGQNTFWTPYMIGGTIQIGAVDPVTYDIVDVLGRGELFVTETSPDAGPVDHFTVVYPNNGQLVDGEHLFAIVVRGDTLNIEFTAEALILDNDVTRCGVGVQDDRDRTSSLFLENIAFCNDVNYDVNWCGCPPIARGNVCRYPKPKNDSVNLSVTCKSCD